MHPVQILSRLCVTPPVSSYLVIFYADGQNAVKPNVYGKRLIGGRYDRSALSQ